VLVKNAEEEAYVSIIDKEVIAKNAEEEAYANTIE
jgi:hypothetical protein